MIRRLLVVAFLCLAATAAEAAQSSAVVGARVGVTTTGLTVANNAELDFGDVIIGVPTSVDPRNAPGAGEIEIRGTAGAEIAISFVLPTELTVGPHSMPIAFGAASGCHVLAFAWLRGACTSFDPAGGVTTTLPSFFFFPPVRFVWLGGEVTPQPGQFPGIYRGSAQVTVSYTGN